MRHDTTAVAFEIPVDRTTRVTDGAGAMARPLGRPATGLVMLALAWTLAACEKTNWETHLYRTADLSTSSVVTDAKQRLVVNRPEHDGRIVCAEPSPDVTQAFAEATKLAASLSAAREAADGSAQNIEASGSFARSYAGAVAQLGERLAVIQLLRDEMYRACEAYANGALTQVSYTLKLARIDKKMATLLSSEMAAGAFGRTLAAVGSQASVGGVDEKSLKDAESAAASEIDALKKLGSTQAEEGKEADKAEKLDAQAKKATAAVAQLVALQQANARLAASATAEQPGSLAGSGPSDDALGVAEIHRNFLDDTGVEPLVDACITAMSSADFEVLFEAKEAGGAEALFASYDQTASYLQSLLDSDGLTDDEQTFVAQAVAPDAASFDDNGMPSAETRQAMQRAAIDARDKARQVLAGTGKGGAFAVKCIETFMTMRLAESGYIPRMISARERLRQIEADSRTEEAKARTALAAAQLTLEKHQACVAAAKLVEDPAARRQALGQCNM